MRIAIKSNQIKTNTINCNSLSKKYFFLNLLDRDHLYWLPPQQAVVESPNDHYKQLHIAVYDHTDMNKIINYSTLNVVRRDIHV